MYNFGKLTGVKEALTTSEAIKDADGNIIREAGVQEFIVLKDKNGVEWHQLFKKHPHKFYIVITDDNRIISMTDDPEKSQIPDHEIIGIDEDYGETFDQGGSVYGKIWDKKQERIVQAKPDIPDSINRRQFFQQAAISQIISEEDALAAMAGTIPPSLATAITKLPQSYQFPVKALVTGAQSFERSHELTPIIAKSFGLDDAQVRQFWEAAAKL